MPHAPPQPAAAPQATPHAPPQTQRERRAAAEQDVQPREDVRNSNASPHCGEADPIVRIEDVHKRFGALVVLNGISLDIRRGENTVILGPSGTGKSVLLKHIVGLLHPDRGKVFFDDRCVGDLSSKELVESRKKIGFLFQMGALFDSMTVGQNVAFPLIEHTKKTKDERADRVEQVLRMVGLPDVQKKLPGQMSGGQRKRVALARAIVLEPCMVLYDEPTTGLDPIRSDVINELIVTLNEELGITSIVVTHDMTSANKIADRMVLLSDGGVVCDGEPERFHQSSNQLVQRFINGQADEEDLKAIREGFEKR